MTIPMLRGQGDELAPILASLTETIGTLLNPTAKFDHNIKALFLEKPELMQKFVDVEKANPGTLRAFGFGEGATNFLSGLEESIPSIQQRLGKDVLETSPEARRSAGAQAATGQTPAQLTGDSVKKWLLGGGLQLMRENPKAAASAMRKIVGLPTELEEEEQASTLAALRTGANLKDLTPNQIVERIVGGKMKITDISGGLVNPQTEGGVKFALDMWQQEKQADLRRELAKLGRSEHNNSVFRSKLSAAIDQRKASGYIGSISTHYFSIWGETPDGSPVDREELGKVTAFQEDAEIGVSVQQKKKLMAAVEPLLNQIKIRKKGQHPIEDSEARLKVNEINKILKAAGIEWEARWDPTRAWFGLDNAVKVPRVTFTNKIGQVTDDPSVMLSTVPPINTRPRASVSPQLSSAEARSVAILKTKTPEEVDSLIEQLYELERKRGGDGSRTDAIVDALGLFADQPAPEE